MTEHARGRTLTGAESGIWYAHQKAPDATTYTCAEYVELTGPLDRDAFGDALRQATSEAPALHTRYAEAEGGRGPLAFEPGGPRGCTVEYLDATGRPDPRGWALEWMREDLRRPRDPAQPPPAAHALIELGPGHHLWYFACHHIALDAYGFSLVQQRVARLYTARARGEAAAGGGFATPRELLEEESAYRASSAHGRDRDRWRELLAEHQATGAPVTLAEGGAPASGRFLRAHGPLTAPEPGGTAGAEDEGGGRLALSRPEFQIAAVAAYLHRVTGRRDVVLGVPFAGRLGSVAARVPSCTVNVLPLPLSLHPGLSPERIVRRTAEALRTVRALSRYRGEDLGRDLRLAAVGRALTGPVVNVGMPAGTLRFAGVDARVHHLSAGPVDDMTFTFREEPGEEPAADGVPDAATNPGPGAGAPRTDALALTLDANPALHTREEAAAHHRRLTEFTAAFLAQPHTPVGRLETATRQERAAAPERHAPVFAAADVPTGPAASPEPTPGQAPGQAASPDAEATLTGLFARQVAAHPDAEAVTGVGERLTYRELDEQSGRLAGELAARGIGRGSLVALALPRSASLVTAVLAVLKTGAGYVPLDPGQPAARTTTVLRSARPALLLTLRTEAPGLPPQSAGPVTEHVCLDDPLVRAAVAGRPPHAPRPTLPARESTDSGTAAGPAGAGPGPQDCAYVIHTSGSTGEPKGVVVPHRNVAALFAAACGRFGFGAADVWTLFHSYAFDFSVWEIFGALLHGGRLVVVPHHVSRSPAEFLQLLVDEQVTVVSQTPSAFGQLVLADREDPATGDRLALRTVVLGGEPLRPAVLSDWYARHAADAPTLVNMYGITETTVHVTYRELGPRDAESGASGLLGEPIPGWQVRLLDSALQPVAPGRTGEIHVSGPGLADGYLGRPALTAERFVPDPYGPPGSRMYRSGDLGRRDAQGGLDHLGRADAQVKIRGFRIEPGEVEAALASHRSVGQAAVVAREDAHGTRLAAYAVPAAGSSPQPAELRRHLGTLLPEHMVPATVVVLGSLPLTANGKLDTAALPAGHTAGHGGGAGESEPGGGRASASVREEVLCTLFADLLGVDRVGPGDGFFALGGHSLLATRLIGRIRESLDATVGVRDLFEAPTPAALAARLETAAPRRPPLRPRPTAPEEGGAPVPLSYAQRRLWFLHRLEGPSPTYNIPLALTLQGPLDTGALGAALDDVAARHESLRTLLTTQDGEPRQHILAPGEAHVEMTVERNALAEDEVSDALTAATRFAFDLSSGLPLRARLLPVAAGTLQRDGEREPGQEGERAEEKHVLLLLLHHAAGDDWSLAPLARDLAAAYSARVRGEAPRQTPLPVQYADYAVWQRELLHGGGTVTDGEANGSQGEDAESAEAPEPEGDGHGSEARRQLDFWSRQLDGLPDQLDLPADRPRPGVAGHRGSTVPVRVDSRLHQGLKALARRTGTTVFMTLQAGLAALLTRLGAGTDIPLGSPVAGRGDPRLDGLVGFFTNTLVLRNDTSGDPDFLGLLARVRESDLGAFDHQDLPFEQLVEELRPPRTPARHPLFQVMLSYGAARPLPRFAGLGATPLTVHNGSAKFDLTLSLRESATGEGLEGFLEYALDLYDEESARTLAERFLRLLRHAVEEPRLPLSRLEILSSGERHRLVHEWNDTAAPVDPRSFPEMFQDQVRRRPQRLALVAGTHRLTYAQLNARANRLAHRLRAAGVEAERTVGIHLPRGAEMIVALLAVQKAGGAFVPLEPSWPAARLAGVIGNAAPAVVLTSPGGGAPLPEGTPALELDLGREWFAGQPEEDPRPDIVPENLSYVIYTSGSTGTPKGAMIRHQAVSNRLPWQIGLLGLTPDDPVLHKAPLTFDISVNEIFLPLAAGAPLVVADAGREGDVAHLLELIARERVAFVYLVSSILELMLEREDAGESAASLRHLWCGGETLTPELFARFRDRLPHATMYHGYGPAETTIGVTCQVYRGGAEQGITIGRPNPNTRVHILDGAMNPVPVGVAGELFLGGVPLGRGYLGDPRRTAGSFVPDPFSREPGARLYRSGDLARHRPDGNIEFLGRADNQVKIHGVRVELEEIEAVLSRHPGVRQAVVLVRRDGPGGDSLSAWCTPDAGPAAAPGATVPDEEGLHAWLRRHLPEYMVPGRCHVLPALPLMTSGKVDRKALAALEAEYGRADAARGGREHTEPAPGTQRQVADAWEHALGVRGVGAHDNFFDLGGHSLLLARVQTALRSTLGWDVPVLDLFTRPTVAETAAHLDSRGGRAPESASAPGSREALRMILPLRAEGELPPLFCLHPASGLSWPFTGLRQHIDPRRPLYGVQSAALGGASVPGSLEEMAAEYVREVRTVQPEGPYCLLGWSFGGVVAHTMATQLQEAGERVALLGMLDSYPRYPWEKLSDDHERQALRSLLYMSHYDISALPADPPPTRRSVMALIAEQGGILSELEESAVQGVMDTFVASAVLQQGAEHRVFHGDLHFFTAAVNPVDPTLTHRDWKAYVDGTVENHSVQCEHKDMTRSGPLAEIGRHLDRTLRDLGG